MEQTNRLVNAAWQVDLGEGKRVEVELEYSNLWVALGPPLNAEVWIKSIAGHVDFRIKVEHTDNGLEIWLDRGPGPSRSWPEENPRIGVSVDPANHSGVAYVRRGERAIEIWRGDFPL
jgi:hypothetical protein